MHCNRHGGSRDHGDSGRRWHHEPDPETPDRSRRPGRDGHRGSGHEGGGRGGRGRHGLHSGRKLSSADLHLILLSLLAKRPSHGYELIKALEDHSHGLYVPSPGMIYPALTYLEEIGFASVDTDGNKKRFSVTEAGREELEKTGDSADRMLADLDRVGAQFAEARQAVENGERSAEREPSGAYPELGDARLNLRRALSIERPLSIAEVTAIAEILNGAAAAIRQLLGGSR